MRQSTDARRWPVCLTAAALALLAAFPVAGQTLAAVEPGSPGVANTGPPEAALFPQLAALQDRLEEQGWLLRGQGTFALQGNAAFRSPYRGEASLGPAAGARNTLSTDLLLGRQLWPGAEVIVDASVTRGFGLANSRGIAAFPSNEAFRIGTTDPYFFVPRAFVRQTVALSGDTVAADGDPLRFTAPLPRERLTFTLGKLSVWDIFDDNRFAHDARTQFMNWALVGAGAVDFAADARGWTYGGAVEWENGRWGLRAGIFQEPRRINGLFMDPAVTRANQILVQADRFWSIDGHGGAARILYGTQTARMSRFRELLAGGLENSEQNPAGYRRKHMAALNLEQELAPELGVFARLSWNDGRTQNWSFTEMDRAISAGASLGGGRWNRPGDTVGVGTNIGWISKARRDYLAAGGIGFIVGDGRLNYAPEWITELYYDLRVLPGTTTALNYQLVVNPAYNADRGPVHILALRVRSAF